MLRFVFGWILIFSLSHQANAGVLVRCPDLKKGESTSGWQVYGKLQQVDFSRVLISAINILGTNTVTCKYKSSLNLVRLGNFQPGGNNSLWHPINQGGITFLQCSATTDSCQFFSA